MFTQAKAFAPWWFLTSAGLTLISAGILILMYPQILVLVISGCIIMAGLFLLSLGLTFKKAVDGVMNGTLKREDFASNPGDSSNNPTMITVEVPDQSDHI